MTKEEALSLMQEAYAGPGSTNEGTFAGDILRACADAIAQMWSMDVDGLARRAFVSTAVGDWLTAVCADRGVERMDGGGRRLPPPAHPQKALRLPPPPATPTTMSSGAAPCPRSCGPRCSPQKRARHRGCDHRGRRRRAPR